MVSERAGHYGPGELALVELRTRLGPLTRAIAWEVDRRVARPRERDGPPGPFAAIAVTEQHARALLETATAFTECGSPYGPGLALSDDEQDVVARLTWHADRAGVVLPCARLPRPRSRRPRHRAAAPHHGSVPRPLVRQPLRVLARFVRGDRSRATARHSSPRDVARARTPRARGRRTVRHAPLDRSRRAESSRSHRGPDAATR